MSNPVATVQEINEAFGRGDIAAIPDSLASEVVWETEGPANPKLTIDEYIASGDTMAAFGRYQATMKATGKVAEIPVAHYWKIHDKKVVRYVGFINSGAFEEALKE